jgi:hypothetical protein
MGATFPLIVIGGAVACYLFMLALGPKRTDRTGVEPAIALIVVLSLAVIWWLATEDEVNVELISGLLVAVVTVVGILHSTAVARADDARRRDEVLRDENRRRDEAIRDFRRALRAEIDDNVRELEQTRARRSAEVVRAAFAAAKGFVPFVVTVRRDRIYAGLVGRLEFLDDSQIDAAVRFYALADKISAIEAAMREPVFAVLAEERRLKVMLDLCAMEDTLLTYGQAAQVALGDRPPTGWVNRTDPGRSGQAVQA